MSLPILAASSVGEGQKTQRYLGKDWVTVGGFSGAKIDMDQWPAPAGDVARRVVDAT
jgi:hypothetical protein